MKEARHRQEDQRHAYRRDRGTVRRRRVAFRRLRDNDGAADRGASRESEHRQGLVSVDDEQGDPAEPGGSDEDERTRQRHGEPAWQRGLPR